MKVKKEKKDLADFLTNLYFYAKQMYSIKMIETYNESSLHKSLKKRYKKASTKEEIKIEGFICDLLTKDNEIIEIQTKNLGALIKKIKSLGEKGYRFRIIYPLVTKSIIKTIDDSGVLISERKSPKKADIFSLFNELLHFYPAFECENWVLEILFIEQAEIREKKAEKVQNKTNTRRFLKDWISLDKHLSAINEKMIIERKKDLLALMPNLPPLFCAKDLSKTEIKKNAHKVLWVLHKLKLIELVEKKGNTKYYRYTQ